MRQALWVSCWSPCIVLTLCYGHSFVVIKPTCGKHLEGEENPETRLSSISGRDKTRFSISCVYCHVAITTLMFDGDTGGRWKRPTANINRIPPFYRELCPMIEALLWLAYESERHQQSRTEWGIGRGAWDGRGIDSVLYLYRLILADRGRNCQKLTLCVCVFVC